MFKFSLLIALLVSAAAFTPGNKRAAAFKTAAPAPVPVQSAPVKKSFSPAKPSFGANKAATPATPAKKVAAPAPAKKAFPTTPAKKAAAPVPVASSDFAYGLVGSDKEVPEFDPWKLSEGRSEDTIKWYRSAEIKHGRICMIAALGLWIQPLFHLPDSVFSSDSAFGAVSQLYAERPLAIWQILIAIGAIEVATLFKNGQGEGDLGFDPLDYKTKYAGQSMDLRELKNGRLAMIGTAAMLIQDYLSGQNVYEQLSA